MSEKKKIFYFIILNKFSNFFKIKHINLYPEFLVKKKKLMHLFVSTHKVKHKVNFFLCNAVEGVLSFSLKTYREKIQIMIFY